MKKHCILLMAANPKGINRSALDREVRCIQDELDRGGHRHCFDFQTRWAAEPLDSLREVRKLQPTVLHFAGRGEASGLVFQDADGRPQVVSAEAIAEVLESAGATVRLALLIACFSEAQAHALLEHVDCVVGVRGDISPAASRSFAIGFYGGLSDGASVAVAFRQGRAAMKLEAASACLELLVRNGVDAERFTLTDEPKVPPCPVCNKDTLKVHSQSGNKLFLVCESCFKSVKITHDGSVVLKVLVAGAATIAGIEALDYVHAHWADWLDVILSA